MPYKIIAGITVKKNNKFTESWNPLNILSCDAATVGNIDLGILNNQITSYF